MKASASHVLILVLINCLVLVHATGRPTIYPWKTNIITTIFWTQTPGFASNSDDKTALNPFYVALPFDDLRHPDLANRWIPAAWKPTRKGWTNSRCADRWVEIKEASGRVCYAQWEDVGPIGSDDASYVFGNSTPRYGKGLDVSPAVAKFLGIDERAQLSWRFVDDANVRDGAWLHQDLIASPSLPVTGAVPGGI